MTKKAAENRLISLKRLFFCLSVGVCLGILVLLAVCTFDFIESFNLSRHIRNEHRVLNVLKLIAPKEAVGIGLVRLGFDRDGGYVMLNEFPKDSVAYSFGVGDNVSWDADVAKRNIDVYMYDHTIDAPPYDDEHFHFFRIGVCGKNNGDKNLKTFDQLLKINGHENRKNIILKMDVEGAEWESLADASPETMERCNQIIVEFHDLNQVIYDEKYKIICDLLRKINKTHQSVHLHSCNYAPYEVIDGEPIPHVMEVTYARRSNHKFTKSYKCYPVENLDKPNHPLRPDYFLGFCGMLDGE
ncbi:MAG: FkbM family methyltransferase [Holosporaceae bacterium]|jgi:hypothetical protein|nr:FkbM family methyltransferase [Holosporaceae bacterium]